MTVGAAYFKFGFVRGGPVSLHPQAPLTSADVQAFLDWAERDHYAFLIFGHKESAVLDMLAAGRQVDRSSRFGWGRINSELIVSLTENDQEMLGRFQPIARRDIRKALAAGYKVLSTRDADVVRRHWDLVRSMLHRKHIRLGRSVGDYEALVKLGSACNDARVYLAELRGRILEMVIVIRDRDTAHYVTGALDVPSLNKAPTPSCLVHWTAMREFRGMGVRRYNLGGIGPSTFNVFKRKFRPVTEVAPDPLIVVFRPRFYERFRQFFAWVTRVRTMLGSNAGRFNQSAQDASGG